MVITRVGENDSPAMTAVLARGGLSGGGFGVAWALVAQVVGYVIQGIGLGKNVYDAVKGAGEQIPAEQKVDPSDVKAIATELQKRFPTTSVSAWETLLTEQLGGKVTTPVVTPCPQGYIRDPATGACIEVKKPGVFAQIPAWGYFVIGGLALLLLPKLGIMKIGK